MEAYWASTEAAYLFTVGITRGISEQHVSFRKFIILARGRVTVVVNRFPHDLLSIVLAVSVLSRCCYGWIFWAAIFSKFWRGKICKPRHSKQGLSGSLGPKRGRGSMQYREDVVFIVLSTALSASYTLRPKQRGFYTDQANFLLTLLLRSVHSWAGTLCPAHLSCLEKFVT